jgi:hypothetical protein
MVSYKKKYLALLEELEKMKLVGDKDEGEKVEGKDEDKTDKKLEKLLGEIARHGDTITNVTIYTMLAAYANQVGFNPLYGVVALKLATSISEVAAGVGVAMLASMGIKGLSPELQLDVLKYIRSAVPPVDIMLRLTEELGEAAKLLVKMPWDQVEKKEGE